jgi:hypothetical protein
VSLPPAGKISHLVALPKEFFMDGLPGTPEIFEP